MYVVIYTVMLQVNFTHLKWVQKDTIDSALGVITLESFFNCVILIHCEEDMR